MTQQYPPYTITSNILKLVAAICERLASLSPQLLTSSCSSESMSPQLRRTNHIRTIHASLAIENNTLSLEQVTAIMDGKIVMGPPRDIQEVRGAVAAYESLPQWKPYLLSDLLMAHKILMHDLVNNAGALRISGVGVFQDGRVVHMAPPAHLLRQHMEKLLHWLQTTEEHPLVVSCVFHYEFEFLHPFLDGNGRMGRLWQTLILSKWNPLWAYIPVETIVRMRQNTYYEVLGLCDGQGEATLFVEFMLQALHDALCEFESSLILSNNIASNTSTKKNNEQVPPYIEQLLSVLKDKEYSLKELMEVMEYKDRKNFRAKVINFALEKKLIERTEPDAPRSPTQKYRLAKKRKRATKK